MECSYMAENTSHFSFWAEPTLETKDSIYSWLYKFIRRHLFIVHNLITYKFEKNFNHFNR